MWQENPQQKLAGLTEETGAGGEPSLRCIRVGRRVCGHATLCSDAFHFVACCHGRCFGLWDVSVVHAAIEEEVFVRPPKNTRKEETIWKLLKDHVWNTSCEFTLGKASVRETLCESHKKVHISVPCVAYIEKEESLVLLRGDDFFAEGHESSLDKLGEVLSACEIKRLPIVGPTVGREGVFLRRQIQWNESGFPYRPDPKHVDALVEALSLEDARLVPTITRETAKEQANTLRVEPD